jgi:hypothetical protein
MVSWGWEQGAASKEGNRISQEGSEEEACTRVRCLKAKDESKAKDFFGIIQHIYTIFANSTKKWQILKDNITGLTPKSVSATRWESRVESVKAIRLQCADIREALLQVLAALYYHIYPIL